LSRGVPTGAGVLARLIAIGALSLSSVTSAFSSFGGRGSPAHTGASARSADLATKPRVGCPDNLADRLASTGRASQLVTAEASGPGRSLATVELWQRSGRCWFEVARPWPALIGENGFSAHHREGDGTTPTGFYSLGRTVYGNQPNPGYRGPYHRLVCGDWWDEDPTSPAYNTFRHLPCGQAPPFGGDSEPLWQETAFYPSFIVVEYNVNPVVPYAGSAIFVHPSTGSPTTGCVSVPRADLDQLLRWLVPSAAPAIAMAPADELARL